MNKQNLSKLTNREEFICIHLEKSNRLLYIYEKQSSTIQFAICLVALVVSIHYPLTWRTEWVEDTYILNGIDSSLILYINDSVVNSILFGHNFSKGSLFRKYYEFVLTASKSEITSLRNLRHSRPWLFTVSSE